MCKILLSSAVDQSWLLNYFDLFQPYMSLLDLVNSRRAVDPPGYQPFKVDFDMFGGFRRCHGDRLVVVVK